MSIRTRLQGFIESKQKIQIWYGMGCHNVCTGRVLFVDQDHVDVESYVHDNEGQINIKRLLIPMHLILHIDITSAETTEEPEVILEAEKYLTTNKTNNNQNNEVIKEKGWSDEALVKTTKSGLEKNLDNKTVEKNKVKENSLSVESSQVIQGYTVSVISKLNALSVNRFSRMVISPRGLAFACDNSVWLIENSNQLTEYARIRGNSTISGLRFDKKGMLYIATVQGNVYRIDPYKSGRILAQLDGAMTGGGTFLSDLVLDYEDNLYVSNFPSNTGGIFKIDNRGSVIKFLGGSGHGTQGLYFQNLNHKSYLWSLEHGSGCVVKYNLNSQEIARVNIAEPESFNFSDGYDGNLAMDSLNRLYVTVGKAGLIMRVNEDLETEIILRDLVNPTGLTFDDDDSLYVLESGKARVIKINVMNYQENKHEANLLN